MRVTVLVVATLCLAAPALLASEAAASRAVPGMDRQATQDAIRAAQQRAVNDLYEQVSVLHVNSRTTVGQFAKALDADDDLVKILARADQIGSPRWLDARTCQVQLEISASRVGYVLKQLAAAYPRRAPASASDIDRAMERWPRKTFVSTGCSASLPALAEFKPLGVRWLAVTDEARRRALTQANDAARRRAVESVGTVVLADQTTISSALANAKSGDVVSSWLTGRPVTRVDFRDDLTVEVALAVDERDFFDVIKTSVQRQSSIPQPRDDRGWERVHNEFSAHFVQPVGQATAESAARTVDAVVWHAPARMPEWVEQSVDIRGTGIGPTKLKAALAAEGDARSKLRGRLESLELEPKVTLADTARKQPAVSAAIERAVERARITRTEYNPDNSASVMVSVELRPLWDDLHR
jgi:hypothetical protein